LLPNHFHFIIRIKPEAAITSFLTALAIENRTKTEQHFLSDQDINKLIEMTFKRFFISYAMAFNLMFKRTGNLFYRTFNRVEISKDSHFAHALVYVHANALKHKLVKEFTSYPWSSYHSIISDKPTKLLRDELIEWFGSKALFIKIRKDMSDYYYDFPGAIEDDD